MNLCQCPAYVSKIVNKRSIEFATGLTAAGTHMAHVITVPLAFTPAKLVLDLVTAGDARLS